MTILLRPHGMGVLKDTLTSRNIKSVWEKKRISPTKPNLLLGHTSPSINIFECIIYRPHDIVI